jgi:hypothetical protein
MIICSTVGLSFFISCALKLTPSTSQHIDITRWLITIYTQGNIMIKELDSLTMTYLKVYHAY